MIYSVSYLDEFGELSLMKYLVCQRINRTQARYLQCIDLSNQLFKICLYYMAPTEPIHHVKPYIHHLLVLHLSFRESLLQWVDISITAAINIYLWTARCASCSSVKWMLASHISKEWDHVAYSNSTLQFMIKIKLQCDQAVCFRMSW